MHLEHDYFWSLLPPQLYDLNQSPDDRTIGQLSECLRNITNIVEDSSDVISYGLVWLAELLRAIGHEVVR